MQVTMELPEAVAERLRDQAQQAGQEPGELASQIVTTAMNTERAAVLAAMAAAGGVTLPTSWPGDIRCHALPNTGRPASEIIIEDRGE